MVRRQRGTHVVLALALFPDQAYDLRRFTSLQHQAVTRKLGRVKLFSQTRM